MAERYAGSPPGCIDDLQSAVGRVHCLAVIAPHPVDIGKARVHDRHARMVLAEVGHTNLDGPQEEFLRLLVLVQVDRHGRQIAQARGNLDVLFAVILFLDGDRTQQKGFGFLVVSLAPVQAGETAERARQLRVRLAEFPFVDGQSALQLLAGVLMPSEQRQQVAVIRQQAGQRPIIGRAPSRRN